MYQSNAESRPVPRLNPSIYLAREITPQSGFQVTLAVAGLEVFFSPKGIATG